MTTEMLIFLIIACFWWLAKMESREAQEEWMVRDMVAKSRHSQPDGGRNPARFGTVGYKL